MADMWKYDSSEIIFLYVDQLWSIRNIAEEKGVGYRAVRNALLREGVVLRATNTKGLNTHSDEAKEKMRQTKLGENNPNWKAKSCTASTKELIRKNGLNRKHSKETKQKMSQTRTEKGLSAGDRNPMRREECLRRWIASNRISPNKCELQLEKILNDVVPGEYQINTRGEVSIIDGAIPDFVSVGSVKRLVEFYGDYWHCGEDEQKRIDRFRKFGYDTLIIWEREFADEDKLRQRIVSFSEGAGTCNSSKL